LAKNFFDKKFSLLIGFDKRNSKNLMDYQYTKNRKPKIEQTLHFIVEVQSHFI
jgi:hypothetical protein